MNRYQLLRPAAALVTMLALGTLSAAGADPQGNALVNYGAVTPENFDSGGAISRQFHLNAAAYLRQMTIARTASTRPLPERPLPALAELPVNAAGERKAFGRYVAEDPLVDGVLVLHRGDIVFEAYPNMAPWQRHFAWSVTKVVVSSALAVLVERGAVDMDSPVDQYLPVLRDSAWAGIPLAHIAHMASGIDCLDSDGYQDQGTCIYTMEEALDITAPTGRNPRFMDHLKAMEMHRESGRRNEYVSANTNVLGLVIEAVTEKPLPRALQDLIWEPMGAEADGLLAVSREGYSYASGGLSARLRDIARFGMLYLVPESAGGLGGAAVARIQGDGVPLTEERIEGLRETFGDDHPTRASWQWDMVWEDGALFKSGYSGQGIYVDPARDLVVAWFGTGEDYDEKSNGMLPVSRQLAQSGRFATAAP